MTTSNNSMHFGSIRWTAFFLLLVIPLYFMGLIVGQGLLSWLLLGAAAVCLTLGVLPPILIWLDSLRSSE